MKKRGSTNKHWTGNKRCPCCGYYTLREVGVGRWSCDYCSGGYKIDRARRKILS